MKGKSEPDVQKIFNAIAMIMTRRGEGNVRVASVTNIQQERKAG